MESNQTMRKWSDMNKLDVVVPGEGKSLGKVEDFFVKEGSNAIYALSVRTRLNDELSLPVTGIVAIEKDHVTIRSRQMLAKAIPPLIRGQQLLTWQVVSNKGNTLGKIKDVLVSVDTPVTMRVLGFEMRDGSSSRSFGADIVSHYNDEDSSIVVYDQSAKNLR